jgi:uncharacterized protein YwqG
VPLYIGIPFLAVFLAIVLRRDIAEWRRQRRNRPKVAAETAAWRQTFEAENPEGPPFTPEDFEEFKAWHASLALPAVELLPAPERPVAASGTRIGGPVWLRDDEAWPTDADGAPLEFVAQVDFAELPPLPDFPATGLLQFFVGSLDRFDVDLQEPAGSGSRVLWRPAALEGGRLHPPPEDVDDASPFENRGVRKAGLSLAGQPAMHLPPSSDWRIDERLEGQLRRPGIEQVGDLLDAGYDGMPRRHHVGGHPVFTQHDFREPGRFSDYDRTLLRLTSDRNLLWGDCGEAVFLVRRRDLLDRDFSSVVFYWDCT